MKKKFKFSILLWSLVFILGAIGFGGCSDDDEEDNIYEGYVEYIEPTGDLFYIKVTRNPSSVSSQRPRTKDRLIVECADFPKMEIKEQQELTFKIISAKAHLHPDFDDWNVWICKIKILKVD